MPGSPAVRPAPVRLLVAVVLVATTVVGVPTSVRAAVAEHPGLLRLADGLSSIGDVDHVDATDDGRHVVAIVRFEAEFELWSWDLESADPTMPTRISQDLTDPARVSRFELVGDLAVYDVTDLGVPRQVFVVPVDGTQAPVLVRGSVTPGEDVVAWGVVGTTGWFVDDADADGPVRLRRRDLARVVNLQAAPVTVMSPPAMTGGVGRVLSTSDGSQLIFEASIDTTRDEIWAVPIDGDSSDAARVSDPAEPAQSLQQLQASGDSTRAVYVYYEPITNGARFEVWSAPLDPAAGDPVMVMARQQANGTFLEDLGLFDPDPGGTSVLANWIPDPTSTSFPTITPIAGPAGAATALEVPAGADAVFPTFDPYTSAPSWRDDGGVLAVAGPDLRLLSYPPDGRNPIDLGAAAGDYSTILREGTIVRLSPDRDGILRTTDTGTRERTLLDAADIDAHSLILRATAAADWLPFVGEDPVYETMGVVSRGGHLVGPFDLEAGFPGDFGTGVFELTVSGGGTHALLEHEVDLNSDGAGDEGRLVALAIPPSAPRSPSGTAGDGLVTVSWDAPRDGMAPDGYEVTAVPADGSAPVVVEVGASATAAEVPVGNGVLHDVTVVPYSDQAGPGATATVTGLLPLEAGVFRVFGTGRVETAVAASMSNFSPGVPAVYVATAENFPDALAAGPAAARDGAPILLLPTDRIPAVVADELERLQPGRIVVLGGAAAVGNEVVAQLADFTDGSVRRLAGDNRYETAAEIAATFDEADRVIVATGGTFPDALAGGALAARGQDPILLVTSSSAPDVAVEQLERLAPEEVLLLGGEGAISRDVEGQLVVLADDLRRIAGTDRFATAAAIADEFPTAVDLAYAATGITFPDALAGTPIAALTGSPVLLVRPDAVPDPAADAITRLSLRRLVVLGGPGAVHDDVLEVLADLLVE